MSNQEGLVLEFTRPTYDYSGPAPDPSWSYIDSQGHEHRWANGKVPTTEEVVIESIYDEDLGECVEYTETRCKECGEKIEPRMIQKSHCVAGPWQVHGVVDANHPVYLELRRVFRSGDKVRIKLAGHELEVRCIALTSGLMGGEARFCGNMV